MKVPKPDKPIPLEVQREKLISAFTAERVNLHTDLKKLLGDEEGEKLYKKL